MSIVYRFFCWAVRMFFGIPECCGMVGIRTGNGLFTEEYMKARGILSPWEKGRDTK